MTSIRPRGTAPRAKQNASHTGEADRTVRIANLTPRRDIDTEVTLCALHASFRIGKPLRIGVPLDRPSTTPAPPRSTWLASRAFLVFDTRKRALRAQAALDGFRHDGAILEARLLGRGPEAASVSDTEVSEVADVADASAFPSLPPAASPPARIDAPRPVPHIVPVDKKQLERDEEETASSAAASSAATVSAVCAYCRRPGHVVRCRGVICCPVLAAREAERLSVEAAERLDQARERTMARKQRQHEAETSGWTIVGRLPTQPSPPADASPPTVVTPAEDAADVDDTATDATDATRAQKRMQRRKEKSRAKRAAAAQE